jgi:bromodomain adjacent to zinc finger domain protein 1A
MLLSSTVWTCSLTGRSGLTFEEAEESEKNARKLLRDFPNELKAPTLLVTALTKRSGISDLVEDVFFYVGERFFQGEEVNFIKNGKTKDYLEILEIVPPAGKE